MLVRAEGALAEWGYVAASRARAETRLYAVGPELVDDAGLGRIDREPAASRLVDALTRAAAQPPATRRPQRDTKASSLAQMARERLERAIESRGRLLASAREELRALGRIARRRRGPALQRAIDAQVRVLADLRLELRDLPAPALRPRPPTLERSPALEARERFGRRPPERGMSLER